MLGEEVILYVEDDEAYAQLMECVLKQSGFTHRMIHLSSAAQAKAYIEGVGEFTDRQRYPLPCLILADLKMPEMTGLEFLDWVRSHSSHRQLPYVILTSSEDLKDIIKAYQLGADSFLVKPPRVPDLVEMVKGMENFWAKRNPSNRKL